MNNNNGYWIKYDPTRCKNETPAICSICNKIVTFRKDTCPRCKSKMDMMR